MVAWRLVVASGVVVFMLLAIIALMVPLKSTVPILYVVDKQTGEVTVGQSVKDFVKSTELNDKHWIKKFLLAHERYNYKLLQHDYDTVQLLAGDQIFAQYAKRFEEGANSLEKRYADNVQITPNILSISITDGKLATVRFEVRQKDMRSSGEDKVTRWVALIRYEYKTLYNRKEAELIDNPLGFQAVAYQVDPELTSGPQGVAR